jgi:hypothetical protein
MRLKRSHSHGVRSSTALLAIQVRVLFAAPRLSKNSRDDVRWHRTDAPCVTQRTYRPLPSPVVCRATSRGDTIMRKFIFIAGFVLASATAHGGDRSLSLSGVERAPAPAKNVDVPRTAEAPVAETPRYTERPAIVDPKAETPRTETPKAETPNAERSRAATSRAGRYRPGGRYEQNMAERPRVGRGRPMMQRTASMSRRGMRPHRSFRIARIIHTLHRYGIYW